ncbi:MAG TPA: hypothetical protein VF327_10740 [Gaiellaceae bacterium]
MNSADASPVSAPAVGAPTTIALFDENGLRMVAIPYRGNSDPPRVLAAMLARWQGFGSCITAGSVFDQEGQTLAYAQV